ncbi:MAG: hypothetical protein HUJ29_06910, partial [Gammaproteobacteria bacterium]|nr:hypothetical protein [Gammaproteobacteria bacterium]
MSCIRQPLLAGLLLLVGHSAWALDLQQSIQHFYTVSPELRAQQAELASYDAYARGAGLWPNTEIKIESRLDGSASELELNQPLPI